MNEPAWRIRALFIGAVLAWFAITAAWPELFHRLGFQHFVPFLDLQAILASNDAVTAGLDPYAPNPLDLLGRPHVYSHWWLHLRDLGLTRADSFVLGGVLVIAFMAVALGAPEPRSGREAVFYFFIFGAPGVLLGIDRANNDLVIFLLLAPVAPCLLSARPGLRWLSVPLLAVAAALKFYPAIAALVLLLAGNPREVRWRAVVAALLFAAVGMDMVRDLAVVGRLIPRAEGLTTFGAVNLLETLGLQGWAGRVTILAVVALFATLGLRSRLFAGVTIPEAEREKWLSFALGSALLTTCFFIGTNYAYRWIFAIWMAPLLWVLPRDIRQPQGVRQLARLLRATLLIALWADSLGMALVNTFCQKFDPATMDRIAHNYFLCEQPVVWTLFLGQVAFLAYFVREGVGRLLGRVTSTTLAPSVQLGRSIP